MICFPRCTGAGTPAIPTHSLRAVRAFTRVELAALVVALGLLSLVVLPALAGNKERSRRVVCLNNLRQIGLAFRSWANDHGDRKPWMTPVTEGGLFLPTGDIVIPQIGTFPSNLRNNAWLQYVAVWRELGTPNVLVCPSDPERRQAQTWDSALGGYVHVDAREKATSYAIGLHTPFEFPRSVLSTDRNLRFNGMDASCFFRVGVSYGIHLNFDGPIGGNVWNNQIHGLTGNVLFNEGRVEELSGASLDHALWNNGADDNGSLHFLIP